MLRELSYLGVLGVGICDDQHGYLVEVFTDDDHTDLATFRSHAQVLTHYCVSITNRRHHRSDIADRLLRQCPAARTSGTDKRR